jgi:hypothetical protein
MDHPVYRYGKTQDPSGGAGMGYNVECKLTKWRLKEINDCKVIIQWGCTTGNAATVAHSTKKTTSWKDSVIEGQPLLLFM